MGFIRCDWGCFPLNYYCCIAIAVRLAEQLTIVSFSGCIIGKYYSNGTFHGSHAIDGINNPCQTNIIKNGNGVFRNIRIIIREAFLI